MLVASQENFFLGQTDVLITKEKKLFTLTINPIRAEMHVTEMRQVSKFLPKSEILNAYCISATCITGSKSCFDY